MAARVHSQIEITPSDKARLEFFIKQENLYYNRLVRLFSSRIRTNPNSLLELTEKEIRFMTEIAKVGKPIRHVARKGCEPLFPEEYSSYADLVYGDVTDRKITLYDMGSGNEKLLPEMRSLMFKAMLNHYKEQAIVISRPVMEEDSYRHSFTVLSEMSTERKRHVQLRRKDVKIKWNPETRKTYLTCPYVEHPILVPANIERKSGWDYLILHQEDTEFLSPSTPWVIDTYRTKGRYLLKSCESTSNRRFKMFNMMKRSA